MKSTMSGITLGVRDMARAKRFYEGLGWKAQLDTPYWISFSLGDGRSVLGLQPWEAAAGEAGLPAAASGFRGVVFSYVVREAKRVEAVLAEAKRAGGTIVKAAATEQWGTVGFFADPDGHLWKVAAGAGNEPWVAE